MIMLGLNGASFDTKRCLAGGRPAVNALPPTVGHAGQRMVP